LERGKKEEKNENKKFKKFNKNMSQRDKNAGNKTEGHFQSEYLILILKTNYILSNYFDKH